MAILQQAARALGGDAAEYVVLGDVVRAHREDLYAVYCKGEGLAVLVPVAVHGQGAQAYARGPHVQRAAFAGKRRLDLIERLRAIAVGPPQLGGVYGDGRAVRLKYAAVGRGHAHTEGVLRLPAGAAATPLLDIRREAERHAARLMPLRYAHAHKAGAVDRDQLYVAPDTGVGQARAPVPAQHAVGLAYVREALGAVAGALHVALGVAGAYVLERREEEDLYVVHTRVCQRSYVYRPFPVHVVAVRGKAAVHVHRGDGVKAVAVQEQRVAGELLGRDGEVALVDVVVLHQREGGVFVVPPEGIVHAAGSHQVGIDRPRHDGGYPFGLVGAAHAPGAIQ